MEFLTGGFASLATFLAIITVLVFVHELGHYLVARRNGVRVEIFSIGFGPELFGWNDRAGTRWRFGAIPLGGYVKMFGDADAASAPGAVREPMSAAEQAVSFHHKRIGQRAAVAAAGPLANFIFGIAVIATLLWIVGDSSAADDGQAQPSFQNPLSVLWTALDVTWQLSVATLQAFWQMIVGARPTHELLGPVRAAALSGGVAQVGFLPVLLLMAIFSVNLGVVNLLPVPVLDGGHLLFYATEAVRGRPLGRQAQKYCSRIGMMAVLSLMIFSTWNDLAQLRAFDFVRGLVT